MDENNILDQHLGDKSGTVNIRASLASGGQRFGNFIIDTIIYYIILIATIVILAFYSGLFEIDPNNENEIMTFSYAINILAILMYFLYYLIMEMLFGKTIGKFITRTRVVNRKGVKPDFKLLLGRSACRLIPFDAFSFLGRDSIGWHDSISDTYVINNNAVYRD